MGRAQNPSLTSHHSFTSTTPGGGCQALCQDGMQRHHVEYDTIPQVVVPVERGLGCWGLRELIGHPPIPPWTESNNGPCCWCSEVGGSFLLPAPWLLALPIWEETVQQSTPLLSQCGVPRGRGERGLQRWHAGQRLRSAWAPVGTGWYGKEGRGLQFSLTFPIGEPSCRPLLGKCEMGVMIPDSRQTLLLRPQCPALPSTWAGPPAEAKVKREDTVLEGEWKS